MKVTPKKKRANRSNAKKSTGPKTASGKSAVALNGVVHGLRSLKPVLPDVEKAEDWQAHRDALIVQLAPEGVVEQAFAERIALGFWRLARCAELEGRITGVLREKHKWQGIGVLASREGCRKGSEAAEVAWQRLEGDCADLLELETLWNQIDNGNDRDAITPNVANRLIDAALTSEEWCNVAESFDRQFDWPPRKVIDVRAMVEWLANAVSETPKRWIYEKGLSVRTAAKKLQERRERIRKAGEISEELAFLDSDVTEKLTRYETTIHRALLRDTHELQRVQAMRLGIDDAVPTAIDLTCDG